ncbi:MAG: DUF4097 domain-containing protein [Thermoanaerobaculales bacterium]|nr:DUF4097 domain-containing protein [Thermoanaerobaculales bacterium]
MSLSIIFSCALISDAALREYFAADDFVLTEGQQMIVDGWDLDIHVRAADTELVRCSTDLRISGTGADTADQWVASRIPHFTEDDKGLQVGLQSSEDGFLGLGKYMRRSRIGLLTPLWVIPDVTTSTGLIDIWGDFSLADPMRLRSSTGNITFRGAAASIEIRTTSGNTLMDVVRPLNRLWARTSSGTLQLSGGAKNIEIETASGSVTLAGLSGSASVETVSGEIIIAWDRLPKDVVVTLRTSKGDIHVTLPPESRPSGRLTTVTGEILSEFPGEIGIEGDTVLLTGDGPTLEIETASGALTLAKSKGWFAPEK